MAFGRIFLGIIQRVVPSGTSQPQRAIAGFILPTHGSSHITRKVKTKKTQLELSGVVPIRTSDCLLTMSFGYHMLPEVW